jgi:hypothetical protein
MTEEELDALQDYIDARIRELIEDALNRGDGLLEAKQTRLSDEYLRRLLRDNKS